LRGAIVTKPMKRSLTLSIVGLVIIVIVVVVIVLVAKNNNNNSTTQSSAQLNAEIQQIKSNWKTFFAYSTSLQGRENLLQNGNNFSQLIQSEFSSLASAKSSAVITKVNLTNSKTASVVYTVDLNGMPELNNENGQALLVNNSWVVSDSTLCHLVSLAGSTPAVCKS